MFQSRHGEKAALVLWDKQARVRYTKVVVNSMRAEVLRGVHFAQLSDAAELKDVNQCVADCVEGMIVVLLRILTRVTKNATDSTRRTVVVKLPYRVNARMVNEKLRLFLRRSVLIKLSHLSKLEEAIDEINTFAPVLLSLRQSVTWNELLRHSQCRLGVRRVPESKVQVVSWRLFTAFK